MSPGRHAHQRTDTWGPPTQCDPRHWRDPCRKRQARPRNRSMVRDTLRSRGVNLRVTRSLRRRRAGRWPARAGSLTPLGRPGTRRRPARALGWFAEAKLLLALHKQGVRDQPIPDWYHQGRRPSVRMGGSRRVTGTTFDLHALGGDGRLLRVHGSPELRFTRHVLWLRVLCWSRLRRLAPPSPLLARRTNTVAERGPLSVDGPRRHAI